MSEKLNSSCPICKGYLFSDDDIVHCPVCGAPHHRDCWQAVGHCGLEDKHGTEQQYTKTDESQEDTAASDKIYCQFCHKELEDDSHFCPYCGKVQSNTNHNNYNNEPQVEFKSISFGGMNMPKIDPYGGVDKESEIDGVKVKDIAKFISFAPNKLLPKFKQFQMGRKTCWNWMAFISPYSHTLFRKMGFQTIMYMLLEITACVLIAPFYHSIMYIDVPIDPPADLIETFLANPLKYASTESILLAVAGVLLFLGHRIFAGLYNDVMYKKHAVSTIKAIRQDTTLDEDYAFQKKGGVRPFLSLLLLLAVAYFGGYVPAFIAGFLFG